MIRVRFSMPDGSTLCREYACHTEVPFDAPPSWLADPVLSWERTVDDPVLLTGRIREGFEVVARGVLS